MELRLLLDPEPAASGAARRAVSSWLEGRAIGHHRDDIVLLTSELVSNALRHGEGHIEVELSDLGDAIRVTVSDSGAAMPEPRSADPDDPSGRGLQLIAALARAWGVDASPATGVSPAGKAVWVEVSVRDGDGTDPGSPVGQT